MALNRRKLVAIQRLLAADATRAIIAAPAAGLALRIFRIIPTCVLAAAQQVEVGQAAGGALLQLMSLPSGATIAETFESEEGVLMTAATALSAVPAAAGPAWHFVVEYQIEKI